MSAKDHLINAIKQRVSTANGISFAPALPRLDGQAQFTNLKHFDGTSLRGRFEVACTRFRRNRVKAVFAYSAALHGIAPRLLAPSVVRQLGDVTGDADGKLCCAVQLFVD